MSRKTNNFFKRYNFKIPELEKKKKSATDPRKPITTPTNFQPVIKVRYLSTCTDLPESQDTKANPKSGSKQDPGEQTSFGDNESWRP